MSAAIITFSDAKLSAMRYAAFITGVSDYLREWNLHTGRYILHAMLRHNALIRDAFLQDAATPQTVAVYIAEIEGLRHPY